MICIFFFQFFKKQIYSILEILIIFTGFRCINEFQQSAEILFFFRSFIPDVADQSAVVESSFDFSPSPLVLAMMVFTSFRMSRSERM